MATVLPACRGERHLGRFTLFDWSADFGRAFQVAGGAVFAMLCGVTNQLALRTAAVLGFTGVALGAFGAHGLEDVLLENDTIETWKTAVLYHFVHTLMLFLLANRPPVRVGPYLCFFAGILIFSGTLYLLALSGARWLGAVTPLGGVAFLAGWLWLAITGIGGQEEGRDRRDEA